MSVAAILLPLFAQIVLIFLLLLRLGTTRAEAVSQGGVKVEEVVINSRAWPKLALQASNCFDNQFQVPVLFYVLTVLELITHTADIFFVLLAWVFVVSRYVHAAIHVTTNNVRLRFPAFAIGVAALVVLWVLFAVKILTGL